MCKYTQRQRYTVSSSLVMYVNTSMGYNHYVSIQGYLIPIKEDNKTLLPDTYT